MGPSLVAMVPDDTGRLLAALIASPAYAHPLVLDVLLGIVYGVALGLALSALRSGSR